MNLMMGTSIRTSSPIWFARPTFLRNSLDGPLRGVLSRKDPQAVAYVVAEGEYPHTHDVGWIGDAMRRSPSFAAGMFS